MNSKLYESDPRGYTLEMVAMGMDADHMLLCALKHMSPDDVRGMLDANEMSPRFTDDDDEE
ncbi:MAG TPA: hypothetical protein ENH62_05825 [Marinobacter sp.]|uniref:Uncharacterized protein n=1 Tax=marine sediment metagenome TaxID=412755 RepID=A0A0F9WD26_9ZZZZ|nr:hypothetical protein [Marinobacter sp.]